MNKYGTWFVFSGIALLTSGCTPPKGVDFKRNAITKIIVGATSKVEIISLFGKPQLDEIQTIKTDGDKKTLPIPIIVEYIRYYYQNDSAKGLVHGIKPSRSASFWLHDDKIIAFNTASNFLSDSTDFDQNRIKSITKDKSTNQDVKSLFGSPSGVGIYPFAKEPDGSTLYYNIDFFDYESHKYSQKQMIVFIDKNNIVSEISLNLQLPN